MRTHLGALRSGFALVTALSVSAFVTDARAYTAEDQQACMGDAFRLCGSDIPNVERITACMIRQKAQLSPQCRAHFRSPESAVRPVARGRFASRSANRDTHGCIAGARPTTADNGAGRSWLIASHYEAKPSSSISQLAVFD